MYLPQTVPLAKPHVALWFGRSGKRYDFAVSRARPMWLGQPVVYVLVRYDGDRPVPLFVGRATAAHPQLGGAGSEELASWEQAMALGMTHLHLRFEACSEEDRAAEVEDLVAAMRPPLNGREAPPPVPVPVPVPEDLVAPSAPVSLVGGGFADLALTGGEGAAAPLAQAPEMAVQAGSDRRTGWLARTAAAFAGRYRSWRYRDRWALAAEAVPGRVTVSADAVAVAVDDARDDAATCAAEPQAAEDLRPMQSSEPVAMPAEPPPPAGIAQSDNGLRDTVRRRMGFSGEDVVVLFAGALDWPAGVDLAVEAMATVHVDPAAVRLLLVGEGPLRGELEARVSHGGFAHACRFLGDLPAEAFAEVFAACDAVVIPARSEQGPMLAEHCLGAGKPVLTTHQARLDCVRHGANGLVAYDNPGSLVWGLRELRSIVTRRNAPEALAA